MPRYTFTFKKDDIFVEFTTEDRDVVERQFQIWVADADDYARHNKTKTRSEKGASSSTAKEEIIPTVNDPAINIHEENIEQPKIEVKQDEVQSSTAGPLEQMPEAFDKASTLLKTINSIQQEQESTPQSPELSGEEKQIASVDFESVLEKSIENPTFEPDKTKDQVYLNLVRSKNTTDKFHYLVITAYYLSEFEKLERFSLKQINAKLMQNLAEVIDSATLQDALNQGFIELVPDLTGTSDVTEYKLTREGEEFFANKI